MNSMATKTNVSTSAIAGAERVAAVAEDCGGEVMLASEGWDD